MQRAYRIRKNKQFRFVYRKGHVNGTRLATLHYVASPRIQAGFSVSKKVGNAVVRNRVKRRMREYFRLHLSALKNGLYVFTARPDAANASYEELGKAMESLFRREKAYKSSTAQD